MCSFLYSTQHRTLFIYLEDSNFPKVKKLDFYLKKYALNYKKTKLKTKGITFNEIYLNIEAFFTKVQYIHKRCKYYLHTINTLFE